MKQILTLLFASISIFSSAQNTITIGNGTTTSLYGPIYIYSNASTNTHSWNLGIYDQGEIMAAGGHAGNFTGISWFKTDTGGYNLGDGSFEIFIKHTTLNQFLSAADFNNEVTGATLVYSSTTQSLPNTIGWIDFVFNTPFQWNGMDNIMVLTRWVRTGFGSDEVLWQSTTTASIRISHSFNTSSTMGSLYTTSNRPNIKLVISPLAALDAGIASLDSLRGRCAGTSDVYATIKNFGNDTIHSVQVNWSVDGTPQTPYLYSGNLAGSATMQVMLGSTTFVSGTAHTYSAWTSNPNGGIDSVSSNDTITFSNLTPGLSGSYTIGPAGADFQTFTDAVSALNNNGVCGPVQISVAPGIYNERLIIHEINNASATNNIIFHSATEDSSSVILDSPSAATVDSNYTLLLSGAKYIAFRSMTFSRSGTEVNCTAVDLEDGSGELQFLHNRFIGPTNMTISNTSGTQSAIYSTGNVAWNGLDVRNNYFTGNANGLWLNGSILNYTQNLIVEDNIFETFYVGTFVLYQNAPHINKNIFVRNNLTSTVDYFAVSLRYGTGAPEIQKNKITAYTGSYGIRLREVIDTTIVPGNIVNNFVQVGFANTGRGISLEDNCAGINIFHNSVNYNGTSSTLGRAFFVDGAGTINIQVLNNIFSNSGSGYATYVSANATAGIIASDNNCLYSTGSTLAYFGTAQATLADLRAASAMDTHSVNADPNFISANDLHTFASNLGDAGSPLANVNDDIDGEARELIHPDIGADEFTVVAINKIDNHLYIKIYPNPAHDFLRVSMEIPETHFILFDVSGREMINRFLNKSLNVVDLSGVPQGFYLAKFSNEEKSFVQRLIVN
jgi:hypothetical protein